MSSAPTTRTQRFQAMRSLWDFDRNINGLGKYKRHHSKLIAHFQNIDVFSIQTIIALETLARLFTTKQERDRQLGELLTRLEQRIDTRRPARLNGEVAPNWGANAAEQEMSVRDEVEQLIREKAPENLPPTATAASTPSVRVWTHGTHTVGVRKSQTNTQVPNEEGGIREQRLKLIAMIQGNWRSAIPYYLPEHCRLKTARVMKWPTRLLWAIFGLSSATRGRSPDDIHASLKPAFTSADEFWLEKTIRAINDLIDFVTSQGDRALSVMTTAQTSSHLADESDSVDQEMVDAGDVNPANTTPYDVQTSEATHQADKRRRSRFITPARDQTGLKKSREAPEEPAHSYSQSSFLATMLNLHTETTRFHILEAKAQAYDNPSLTPPTRLSGPNRLFEAGPAVQQARFEYEETVRQANTAVQDR